MMRRGLFAALFSSFIVHHSSFDERRENPNTETPMERPFAITLAPDSGLANKTGPWRTQKPQYVHRLPPCNNACPAGENVQEWLYAAEVPASGLQEHEVVADITGATKPMSIGMLLACRGRGPVQYMAHQPAGPSQPLLLPLAVPNSPPNGQRSDE